MSDRKNTNIADPSEVLRCISAHVLEVIQEEVKRRLRSRLTDLVGSTTWQEKSWRLGYWTIPKTKSEWPRDFASAYDKALTAATVDLSGLLTQAIIASRKKHRKVRYESIFSLAVLHTQPLRSFTLAEPWLRLAMETVFEEAGEEVPRVSFSNIEEGGEYLLSEWDPRVAPDSSRIDKWVVTPTPEHGTYCPPGYVMEIPEDVRTIFFGCLTHLFENWPERVWHAVAHRITLCIYTTPTPPRSVAIEQSGLSPAGRSELFHESREFTRTITAAMLERSYRQITNLVNQGKLTKSGRNILNDDKFKALYFNRPRRKGPTS